MKKEENGVKKEENGVKKEENGVKKEENGVKKVFFKNLFIFLKKRLLLNSWKRRLQNQMQLLIQVIVFP